MVFRIWSHLKISRQLKQRTWGIHCSVYYVELLLDTTRAAASSYRRARGERRLEELADRQRRRIELMERQAADAERMLSLRDSRAFRRLLLNELRQCRRREVLDRYFCLRHDEHLRALAAARKAQEEQVCVFSTVAALCHHLPTDDFVIGWFNYKRQSKSLSKAREREHIPKSSLNSVEATYHKSRWLFYLPIPLCTFDINQYA